jgi:hypothetical protein
MMIKHQVNYCTSQACQGMLKSLCEDQFVSHISIDTVNSQRYYYDYQVCVGKLTDPDKTSMYDSTPSGIAAFNKQY